MKVVVAAILVCFLYLDVTGQNDIKDVFYQAGSKSQFYYVNVRDVIAIVYEMRSYIDKAGTGSSIRQEDTLSKVTGGSYVGKSASITANEEQLFLVLRGKKTKTLKLEPIKSESVTNHQLNNAYFLDSYFSMCREITQSYPLSHLSFRGGFYEWKKLENKEMDHVQFRKFVDTSIGKIKDTISQIAERNIALTDFMTKNLKTLNYDVLKDSLTKFPADYGSRGAYYSKVINEVSKQKPEFFFRLAEDFPNDRALIFSSAGEDDETIKNFRAVEGHAEIKKVFFKERRFSKSLPYKIIGIYAVIAALVVLLISSQ